MGCEALVDYVRCVSVCIYILRDQYQHSIICYLLQAENQIMSMNTDKFTFEELQLWNSARLKDYLGDRRLSVTGSIEKLRATVYGAQVYGPFSDRVGLPLHNIHIPSPFTIMDMKN